MSDVIDNDRLNMLRIAREMQNEMDEIDRVIDALFLIQPTGEMTVFTVVERARELRDQRTGDNVVQFIPRNAPRT